MSDPEAKIKKIRTFYEDASNLRDANFKTTTSVTTVSDSSLVKTKKSTLAVANHFPTTTKSLIDKVIPLNEEPLVENKTPLISNIDTSALKSNIPESLLSGHGAIFSTIEETGETAGGNIITDQKRKSFKLLPAMGMALGDWFYKQVRLVKKLLQKREVGHKISAVTNRESVVKAAAKRSSLAPSDDYTEVARRITQVNKPAPLPSALIIKKPTEVTNSGWTHLEGQEDPESSINNQMIEVPPLETVTEPFVEIDQLNELAVMNTPVISEIVTEPIPGVDQTQNFDQEFTPVLEESIEPETALPTSKPLQTRYYAPANYQVSLPLWRISAIAVLAILLGVSFTLWWFANGELSPIINNENQFTSLINADEKIPIALGSDNLSLQRNIQAVQPRPTSLAIVAYPTVNIAGTNQPASVTDILNTLAWQASGSFLRGITEINFGLYRNRDPFIVLKVTAFDSAFGGILDWENTISADISPLFGAPINGTFDPQARTATQIREPYFVDVVVNNIDARLLTDETQKERIVYAFTDRNTIIITTTQSTLGDLLNLLR